MAPLDGWGYSPLDQVTPENVGELRLVWSRALTAGTQEGTPLAYGGVLYVPQASDVIQAIDAVTGDLKWNYHRDLPDDVYEHVGGNARNNRNIAIFDRLIINTSDDSYVFALDAATGDTAWETQILDYKVNSATHSSGPIIANGKVISGRSCRPWGGPEACVITAHDARTGAELWRRRTIPAPGEPGDETWGGVPFEERKHVGTWMVPSYDPELNLIYIGTSITSPAPKFLLGGADQKHLYRKCCNFESGDGSRFGIEVSCRHLEQPVDELNLAPHIRAAHPPRLPLPNHVHGLVALDCPPRRVKLAKPLFGLYPSFDRSMVLLQDMVHVLARPMAAAAAQGAFLFHGWNRRAVEAGLIGVDDAGLRMR